LLADFAADGAVINFVGRSATPGDIKRAVCHSDFVEFQRQENERDSPNNGRARQHFFAAGWAGGWRQVLTAEQVKKIERCHDAVMATLGYKP